MEPLSLHEFHARLSARFAVVNGAEAVADYGDSAAEYSALVERAGVLDLSFRGRVCLVGADRIRFLHGQVTNDIKSLKPGQGCYAALTTAKGKLESDLNIFCLKEELLLDFEPGLTQIVTQRLEKYVVADDVQVVDVAPHYGLWSVQGPNSGHLIRSLKLTEQPPATSGDSVQITDPELGEICLANHPRLGSAGFDLFVPANAMAAMGDRLAAAAGAQGGRFCGWSSFETARVEAGIPRFGVDMDTSNLPQECGIENRAVSYNKGCYIGQEVLNRIHTMGQVVRHLRGLRLADEPHELPARGDKLFRDGKEVGYVTSAIASPKLNANIALGYVRKGANQAGTELLLRSESGERRARVVDLPF